MFRSYPPFIRIRELQLIAQSYSLAVAGVMSTDLACISIDLPAIISVNVGAVLLSSRQRGLQSDRKEAVRQPLRLCRILPFLATHPPNSVYSKTRSHTHSDLDGAVSCESPCTTSRKAPTPSLNEDLVSSCLNLALYPFISPPSLAKTFCLCLAGTHDDRIYQCKEMALGVFFPLTCLCTYRGITDIHLYTSPALLAFTTAVRITAFDVFMAYFRNNAHLLPVHLHSPVSLAP